MRLPVFLIAAGAALSACAHFGENGGADAVIVNAVIYTADAARSTPSAMAIRKGVIVFVGGDDGAKALAGQKTQIVDAGGKLILPGLHDAHLHPISAMPIETCSLDNSPRPLTEIASEAQACIARLKAAPGTPVGIQL